MARHYLDHASTSPLRPEAADAIRSWLEEPTVDPARLYADAARARHAMELAREQVAGLLGARSREVVFTSGASESIASAAAGVAGRGTNQVVPRVEHQAVRRSAPLHGEVRWVGADRTGRIDLGRLTDAIDSDTALVHCQLANHEVGTVQPVAEVVDAAHAKGVLVHVDAAAAIGRVPFLFSDLGADLVSVSAHKLGGPPGTGALLVRRGLRIDPLIVGGEQERARRAGMENALAAVGFAAVAAALTPERMAEEIAHQRGLADRLRADVLALPGVSDLGDPDDRMPHMVSVMIDDVEPQAVLIELDRAGIAAHSGSSCAAEGLEPSVVLEAMGVDARRSLRLSLGWSSCAEDVDAVSVALGPILERLRALGSSG